MQATVKSGFTLSGAGLHTGEFARLSVLPAAPDSGIVFKRTDVADRDNLIPASYRNVVESKLCTKIANGSGVSVQTIEHLMAGLAVCGVRNALVEVSGPEVPKMDGSALRFAQKALDAGILIQDVPISVIKIRRPVEYEDDSAKACLLPADSSEMEFSISYPEPIGDQTKSMDICNGEALRELVHCRTFCTDKQAAEILASGLGRGGDLQSVVVAMLASKSFSVPLRCDDECVRHKLLDAIGDLALAGRPIVGKFVGVRSGHRLTCGLLRRLFETGSAVEVVADEATVAKLPGVGARAEDIPLH